MAGIDLSTLNAAQRRIATTLDEPLFVEAGAGSGKTFTLTRRVVWALSPGSGPDGGPYVNNLDEVLVITFTTAAAQEIKERVRGALRDAGMHEASLAVDSAWISTIHGMCSRILRRNALDLGLDPAFGICSSHEERDLLDVAVEQVVGAERRKAARGSFVAEAFDELEYGGVVSRVAAVTAAAHAAPHGFDDLWVPKAGGVTDAMESLTMCYEALDGAKLSASARAVVDSSLEALLNFSLLPPEERTAEEAARALTQVKLPRSSKAIAELHAEAKEALNRAKATVPLAQGQRFAPLICKLARLTDERYTELKRERALLDNDDLVSLALAAVRDNPMVAARYAGKFKLVMVDEFQDTDTKQLELISLLAGGAAKRGAEPRHLATVGDAQQSIYRFRGADVSVFFDRGARIPETGKVRLDTNYRSHGDVLAFVERVCGGREGVLKGFMHLDDNPGRKDGYVAKSLPRVSVELASGPVSGAYASAQQTAVLAAQVADRLARYRDAGESAGGMALLLGATGKAGLYIDALRARGLECVVSGGSTFTSASEVKVMLALLRTLANPRDTQSGLFQVLSSPMFELDANDFLQLGSRRQVKLDAPTKRTIDQGIFSLDLYGGARPSERLRVAHEVLGRAVRDVATKPVADVCLDVVRDSGWLARLESEGAAGVAREANVLAAVRYIRELTEELGLGPMRAAQEFALWLEVSKIPPASLAGAAKDTVRIMTVHASKGLEYPVVAVAECWNNPRNEGGVILGPTGKGTTAVIVRPRATLKFDGIEHGDRPSGLAEWAAYLTELNAEADQQEKARLLYVALTRAREALVLGLCAATSKKGISSRLAAGTVGALFDGGLPAVGKTVWEYGGSAPAEVRHVAVSREKGGPYVANSWGELAGMDGELDRDVSRIVLRGTAGQAGKNEADAEREVVLYVSEENPVGTVELTRARAGVFSYSSALAGHAVFADAAAAGSTVVDGEANREDLPTGLEAAPGRGVPAGPQGRATNGGGKRGTDLPTRAQRDAEAEGEAWTHDEDKATNLGSAFHMLAQTMVETGREVDGARKEALCRRWHLSARQRARLDEAIAYWQGSDLRKEVLGYGLLRAEVPFFSAVDDPAYTEFGSYVEGAIDLLCTDGPEACGHALVVDYKTGDRGLTEEQIRARHANQAALYARVLIDQGFSSVTCAFVCVEVGVTIRYEFDADL